MRKLEFRLAFALMVSAYASFAGSSAQAFSDKVKKACAGDYQNYCSQYAAGTPQLRACFESNRKGLTRICVSALVDAGEVPAKYLKK